MIYDAELGSFATRNVRRCFRFFRGLPPLSFDLRVVLGYLQNFNTNIQQVVLLERRLAYSAGLIKIVYYSCEYVLTASK